MSCSSTPTVTPCSASEDSAARSSPDPPSSTASTAAASATVFPIGPAVSCPRTSGTIPAPSTRPCVAFMPTTPLNALGASNDPEVSVPTLTTVSPAATPAAEPLLEPPGENATPCGLAVSPPTALTPGVFVTAPASSERLALARITAPASRSARTIGASADATLSASTMAPAVVRRGPAVSMLSLIVTGMPSSRPRVEPARRRSSDARA